MLNREALISGDYSFCLGRSNSENAIVEGSSESFNDSAANLGLAIRLDPDKHIKLCHKFPASSTKYLSSGMMPGSWYGDETTSHQHIFIQGSYMFMFVGNDGTKNRIDKAGSSVINNPLTVFDGSVGSESGMQYIALNALPREFDEMSSKYAEIKLWKDELAKLDGSTTLSNEAKSICGAGGEGRTGNCCLYYGDAGSDPIAGTTHDAGDFYRCICSKCYRCIEIAKALDMRHVFKKFDPPGCTTCGCTGCDEMNCTQVGSPCECSIDLTQQSHYSDILGNNNIASTTPVARNAKIFETQETKYSGSIYSVAIDLGNLTWGQKTLASAYEADAAAGTLFLPIKAGECDKEAFVKVSTVYDSISAKYIIDGLLSPEADKHGSGYSSAKIDRSEWNNMFPNFPTDDIESRFKFQISPLGGFYAKLEKILDLSCVIHVVVKSKEVRDTFAMTEFDFYSISQLFTEDGGKIYSNFGRHQQDIKSLVTVFNAKLSHSGMVSESTKPLAKEYAVNSKTKVTTSTKNIFENTTKNLIVPYDSTIVDWDGSGDGDTARIPIQTSNPSGLVGKPFSNCPDPNAEGKLQWLLDSIYYRPKREDGHYYAPEKTVTLIRNPVTMNLDKNKANQHTTSFEIEFGDPSATKTTETE